MCLYCMCLRTTASDRLASPPMPLSRNTLLPPIATGDTDLTYSGQHSRLMQVQPDVSNSCLVVLQDESPKCLVVYFFSGRET